MTQWQQPESVTRSRIYRAVVTRDLLTRIDTARDAQRAVYNMAIAAAPEEGGPLPALQKSPHHPDAFYAQLTQWRSEYEWLAAIPVAIARPAITEARGALVAHEEHLAERTHRLLAENKVWTRWMTKHPDWDTGAWDALSADEKRAVIDAGDAPPKCVSTWRDARAPKGTSFRPATRE